MVAESGAVLLEEDAREALVARLLPRASVVTPNLPEAQVLAGAAADAESFDEETGLDDVEALARAIHGLGPRAVVVTGGHRAEAADVFFDGERMVSLPGERHPPGASHGSGCTHSSALAALMAHGASPLAAARGAREAAGAAVRDGLRGLGSGAGPVDALGVARRAPAGPLT
jgi:hydroxymethylpyrimidine/phosphomethylpyrimidine kinase